MPDNMSGWRIIPPEDKLGDVLAHLYTMTDTAFNCGEEAAARHYRAAADHVAHAIRDFAKGDAVLNGLAPASISDKIEGDD